MSLSPGQLGAVCAIAAVLFFSANDTTIKFLSGDYALHQIVLIRSILGLLITVAVIAPFQGGLGVFRTRRLSAHLMRGGLVVVANMALFLAFAAMPLADATAIFFVSPILITLFSVVFLNESVGPWRWAATAIGFAGVVVMMRPGSGSFQVASTLPLVAAVAYAGLNTMTRKLGTTEGAVTLSVYIKLMFIVVSLIFGLAVGDGRFGDQADPSLQFLLRAWYWPDPADAKFFVLIGIGVAGAGLLISQAYRVAEAAYVAPFEYVALPLAVFWGIVVFDEWPDLITYLGMGLIGLAGMVTMWREAVNARVARPLRRGS